MLDVGSLIVLQEGINPCKMIGRYGGDRLSMLHKSCGIIIEITDHWGSLWGKVLFPAGIAWIELGWIESFKISD